MRPATDHESPTGQQPDILPQAETAPSTRPATTPVWERFLDAAARIPEDVAARLPEDGAEQHDHFVYGIPKRGTSG